MVGSNNGKRAVLVFFADKKQLMNFYDSKFMDDIRNKVNYLTEEASADEIFQIVKKATTSGRVTLFTRTFGRGTDFCIQDESVKLNGGTCTIQTFPSESLSEEKQMKGRSAR